MADTNRWVARLSWALVVAVVISAILQLGLALGLFVPFPNIPEGTDLVDANLINRAADQQVFGFVAASSLAAVAVYLVGGLLGPAIRPLAEKGTSRDVMVAVFLIAAAVGIVGQLVNLATSQVATFGYCDCGYKTEEVIAQDYALRIGVQAQFWLGIAAVTLVGVAIAFAGMLVSVSPAWRTLSYVIALVLLIAVVIRVLTLFVRIQTFDPYQVSDLIVALASGILVPIWAAILALSMRRTPAPQESTV